jgi:hypothetical protein
MTMPKPHIQGVTRRILIRRENKALRVTVETLAWGTQSLTPYMSDPSSTHLFQ